MEERVFEYARGACAASSEPTPVVVQQVIDLADGDPDVLSRAVRYCGRESADDGGAASLLHAALEQAKATWGDTHKAAVLARLAESPTPELLADFALLLAEEGLHVSIAVAQLLATIDTDRDLLEAAHTDAIKTFAARLAAGEAHTITALEILEGARARIHDTSDA